MRVALLAVCAALCQSNRNHITADTPSEDRNPDFPQLPNVQVADYSDLKGVPKMLHGGRVLDVFNGEHFDDVNKDTPFEMRPGSIILFHGFESCPDALTDLDYVWQAENTLPARERLNIATYDMDRAHRLAWYKFTPERDLKKRFGVTRCPELVYAPPTKLDLNFCKKSNNNPDSQYTTMGCEDFEEPNKNLERWDGQGSWVSWVETRVANEPWPKLNRRFDSYNFQGRWIQARSDITTNTQMRNMFMSQTVPPFTHEGVAVVDTPKELQDWLVNLYRNHHIHARKEKMHDTETQNSHMESTAYIIDLHYGGKATQMANKYLRPLITEWTGIRAEDLEMTSFYGIREYEEGHFLRNHIDRMDTHVLSLTLSVAKIDNRGEILESHVNPVQNRTKWPLSYVNYAGDNVEFEHPPGSAVLYESAKVPHGRSLRNPKGAGYHLGAFCHFAPKEGVFPWMRSVGKSRSNVWKHVKRVDYKQTDSIEPKEIVWTSRIYAEIAINDISDDEKEVEQQWVAMHNKSPEALNLYWISDNNEFILNCAAVQPGKSCNIGTHPGHRFGWGLDDNSAAESAIAKASVFKIKSGVKDYSYRTSNLFASSTKLVF